MTRKTPSSECGSAGWAGGCWGTSGSFPGSAGAGSPTLSSLPVPPLSCALGVVLTVAPPGLWATWSHGWIPTVWPVLCAQTPASSAGQGCSGRWGDLGPLEPRWALTGSPHCACAAEKNKKVNLRVGFLRHYQGLLFKKIVHSRERTQNCSYPSPHSEH